MRGCRKSGTFPRSASESRGDARFLSLDSAFPVSSIGSGADGALYACAGGS